MVGFLAVSLFDTNQTGRIRIPKLMRPAPREGRAACARCSAARCAWPPCNAHGTPSPGDRKRRPEPGNSPTSCHGKRTANRGESNQSPVQMCFIHRRVALFHNRPPKQNKHVWQMHLQSLNASKAYSRSVEQMSSNAQSDDSFKQIAQCDAPHAPSKNQFMATTWQCRNRFAGGRGETVASTNS